MPRKTSKKKSVKKSVKRASKTQSKAKASSAVRTKSKQTIKKKTAKKSAKKVSKKVVPKVIEENPHSLRNVKSTKDIHIPKKLIDQVIGQEHAVNIMRKAAMQRRHVLLVGEPGTGKSLIGLALSELLSKEKLVDIVSFANPNDENKPLIRTVPAKQGRELIAKAKMSSSGASKGQNIFFLVLAVVAVLSPWWIRSHYLASDGAVAANILFAATFLGGMAFLVAIVLIMNMGKKMMGGKKTQSPKMVVDNAEQELAPFFDATGAHAGALLGDVLHDPFQSGGLGTPAHERVVGGMIHKAHMGVLFIDELSTLHPTTQQELLTAVQEGKFAITGQSERSAGAMVRTEPVPCRFLMVAAGNLESIKGLHPALRSRIRGYGYEIYMKETMEDTPENRVKLAQFVAQEVTKDGKIPHFSKSSIEFIINEAKRRASKKGRLTLRLRELGGLVRSAGDLAIEEKAPLVKPIHLERAKQVARGLEQQIADRYIEHKKDYEVIVTKGKRVGRVNGLAVLGDASSLSGIILPIESEVTKGSKHGKVFATGKLGEIAKEAITNVSAIIKKYFGDDIKDDHDIFIQFLQTHEGVEGDSASLAVATAIVSALKNIPIRQNFAITGSVSVRGDTLPVGGVSAKLEAAIGAGIKNVIVPRTNLQDIVIDDKKLKKINIIPVDTIVDVLEHILDWRGKTRILEHIKTFK